MAGSFPRVSNGYAQVGFVSAQHTSRELRMVLVHAPKNYFMKKAKKAVLVAGAQGVIGRASAEHLSEEADATVYGVSRRPVVGLEKVQPISADLMNLEDTRKKLGVLKDVTHVVFGAY